MFWQFLVVERISLISHIQRNALKHVKETQFPIVPYNCVFIKDTILFQNRSTCPTYPSNYLLLNGSTDLPHTKKLVIFKYIFPYNVCKCLQKHFQHFAKYTEVRQRADFQHQIQRKQHVGPVSLQIIFPFKKTKFAFPPFPSTHHPHFSPNFYWCSLFLRESGWKPLKVLWHQTRVRFFEERNQ